MKIQDITTLLESIAPVSLQEEYDNAGLLTGNVEMECTGVIICLDVTEAVIAEAVEMKCNLVVAHHPVIFRGLKKLNGKNYVERTIIQAIRNEIAVYAIHTNLDNKLTGVNKMIADKLGLEDHQVLAPRESMLQKLITFVPVDKADAVRNALFKAGAGNLGKYSECSFNTEGSGTFTAGEGADPYVGKPGERHTEREMRVEVIFPGYLKQKIVAAMIAAHPYEEAAYDILSLGNYLSDVGAGLAGKLPTPITEAALMDLLKSSFGLQLIRHSAFTGKKVQKIAVCGGAGIFLLPAAKAAGADVFITADVKYHEFFDADGQILLADIGHYESEQFTIDLLFEVLRQNFPNFAVLKTGINTNPVKYY